MDGVCDECDRQCSNGILVDDREFEGQFYCDQCWARWLEQPFHFQFTLVDAHTEQLQAWAGAEILVEQQRARVVDPYFQPGRLRVRLQKTPFTYSEDEVTVQHRHAQPYSWKSIHGASLGSLYGHHMKEVVQEAQEMRVTSLQEWAIAELREVNKCSNSHLEICDLGCGLCHDAVHFAESLGAHVFAIDICEEMAEVIEAPDVGKLHMFHQFDMFSLCDLAAVERRGWRHRFHAIWSNSSFAHLTCSELQELLVALHFCVRPNGLIAFILPHSAIDEKFDSSLPVGHAHLELYNESVLRHMLQNAGWESLMVHTTEHCVRRGTWLHVAARSLSTTSRCSPLVDAVLRCQARWTNDPDRAAHGQSFDHASQPDRFLRFKGSPMVDLPMEASDDGSAWIGQLMQDAFGITRWQSLGGDSEMYCFRINPTSGGLQPLEIYFLTDLPLGGRDSSCGPTLYHYHSFWHAAEALWSIPQPIWRRFADQLPKDSILIAFTAFYFRACWKYGEVSFPAIQRDTGHAIACLTHAALALNRQCALLEDVGHEDVANLLGIASRGPNAQQPQALLAVTPTSRISACDFRLSEFHFPRLWTSSHHDLDGPLPQLTADAHLATWKPPGVCSDEGCKELWMRNPEPPDPLPWKRSHLRQCIRQRRSYYYFDPEVALTRIDFYTILQSIMPHSALLGAFRFAATFVPLVIVFVQNVSGLSQGLYALVRSVPDLDWIRTCTQRGPLAYKWRSVPDAPSGLPFFLLDHADVRECADTCTLGHGRLQGAAVVFMMFGRYIASLQNFGSWTYRRLLWEAGAIGQSLYVAAEASGFNGTGHGAFFGNLTHALLQIDTKELLDLYHFAIGKGCLDKRMQLPPYEHLDYYRSVPDRDLVDTTFAFAEGSMSQLQVRVRGRGCG